ncbi:hypothetical protein ACLOJK_019069, partial [Asimina triloba]
HKNHRTVHHPRYTIVEHLRCSTLLTKLTKGDCMAAAGEVPDTAHSAYRSARSHYHDATVMLPPSVEPCTATVDGDEEDTDVVIFAVGPTTVGPSSPRSKPLIMTKMTSTFQIRRGCKPTLITKATRGKSSSPIINKFIFIPLRSSPISNLNHTIIQSGFLGAMVSDLIQSSGITNTTQIVHCTACTAHLPPNEQAATACVDAIELLPTTPTGPSVRRCLDPALSPIVVATEQRHGHPIPLPATLPTLVPLPAAAFTIVGLASKPPCTARPPSRLLDARNARHQCPMSMSTARWHVGMGVARPHRPTATTDVEVRSRRSYSGSTTACYSTPIIAYKRM